MHTLLISGYMKHRTIIHGYVKMSVIVILKEKGGHGNIWIIISFVKSKWAEAAIKYKISEKGMCEKGKFKMLETCTRYRSKYGIDIDTEKHIDKDRDLGW